MMKPNAVAKNIDSFWLPRKRAGLIQSEASRKTEKSRTRVAPHVLSTNNFAEKF